MPASSHYKAKGRPTVRKAVTALARAIARKGKGKRRGRRGGMSWIRALPAAINAIPSYGLIPNSNLINAVKNFGTIYH
jgi:hypothetical protein